MDNLSINFLDILIMIVVVISGIIAYTRGFVREVLSIGGWLGAIFITFYSVPVIRPYAQSLIPNELGADIAAVVVIFIGSLIILSLIIRWISGSVRDSALNAIDRSLGILFGLVRGIVIVCLVYTLFKWLVPTPEHPEWIREAKAIPFVERGVELLTRLLPENLAAQDNNADNAMKTKARKLYEAERQLRKIITPRPVHPSEQEDQIFGYTDEQRKALDRLIQTDQ